MDIRTGSAPLINFDENTVYGYDPKLKTWQNYNMKDLAYFSGLLGSAQLDQNSIASSRELLNRFVSFYSNASYTRMMINMYFLEVFVGIVRTCGELIRNTRINLYGQSGEVGISIKRNSFKRIL